MTRICERTIHLQTLLKGAASKKNYLRGFEELENPHLNYKNADHDKLTVCPPFDHIQRRQACQANGYYQWDWTINRFDHSVSWEGWMRSCFQPATCSHPHRGVIGHPPPLNIFDVTLILGSPWLCNITIHERRFELNYQRENSYWIASPSVHQTPMVSTSCKFRELNNVAQARRMVKKGKWIVLIYEFIMSTKGAHIIVVEFEKWMIDGRERALEYANHQHLGRK